MKNFIIKSIFAVLLVVSLNGCYTVIWTPEQKITPTEEMINGYYSGPVYEPYYYYYERPWWYDVDMPYYDEVYNNQLKEEERNRTTGSLRNNDGGRDGGGREIKRTDPVSTGGYNNTGSSTGSSNTSSGTNTRTESTTKSNERSGSDNKGSLRNNDSGRNSSGDKRKR